MPSCAFLRPCIAVARASCIIRLLSSIEAKAIERATVSRRARNRDRRADCHYFAVVPSLFEMVLPGRHTFRSHKQPAVQPPGGATRAGLSPQISHLIELCKPAKAPVRALPGCTLQALQDQRTLRAKRPRCCAARSCSDHLKGLLRVGPRSRWLDKGDVTNDVMSLRDFNWLRHLRGHVSGKDKKPGTVGEGPHLPIAAVWR